MTQSLAPSGAAVGDVLESSWGLTAVGDKLGVAVDISGDGETGITSGAPVGSAGEEGAGVEAGDNICEETGDVVGGMTLADVGDGVGSRTDDVVGGREDDATEGEGVRPVSGAKVAEVSPVMGFSHT